MDPGNMHHTYRHELYITTTNCGYDIIFSVLRMLIANFRQNDCFSEGDRARQLRRNHPTKSINQQIDQTPKFPSFYDQSNLDQTNRFNLFGEHEHPSFSQTSGGRLPSIDEIKEDHHPHKLITPDRTFDGSGNYDNGHGHVIDGSKKRLFVIKVTNRLNRKLL